MDNLPIDIITIILSNLVIKSLLCCRSVCKRWRSIIDNPRFAQLHLDTSSTKSNGTSSSSFIFCPKKSNNLFMVTDAEHIPPTLNSTRFDLFCDKDCKLYMEAPVNGLVLLYTSKAYRKSYRGSMYIFNPSIQDCLLLPKFRLPSYNWGILMPGFGYDNIGKKFKVVQMCVRKGDDGFDTEVRVYTLGSNSWKKVGKPPIIPLFWGGSAFVDGSIHWLGVSEEVEGCRSIVILSFNLGVEEFGVSKLSFLPSRSCKHIQVMALGKYLSLVDTSVSTHYDIWILKDQNVKKAWSRYRIKNPDEDVGRFQMVRPLSSWRNGEIALLGGSRTLLSYNFESKRFTSLEIDGIDKIGCGDSMYDSLCTGGVFSYIESLIPVTSASIGATLKRRKMKNEIQDRKVRRKFTTES